MANAFCLYPERTSVQFLWKQSKIYLAFIRKCCVRLVLRNTENRQELVHAETLRWISLKQGRSRLHHWQGDFWSDAAKETSPAQVIGHRGQSKDITHSYYTAAGAGNQQDVTKWNIKLYGITYGGGVVLFVWADNEIKLYSSRQKWYDSWNWEK